MYTETKEDIYARQCIMREFCKVEFEGGKAYHWVPEGCYAVVLEDGVVTLLDCNKAPAKLQVDYVTFCNALKHKAKHIWRWLNQL